MAPNTNTTYKVVELIAEEPHLPDHFALLEVSPTGEERVMARSSTLEALHHAVSALMEGAG